MPETDEERKKRQHAEVREYERANGIVPSTAQHRGDSRGPEGGQDWAGRARMAEARAAAGVALDEFDRIAVERASYVKSGSGHDETAVAS